MIAAVAPANVEFPEDNWLCQWFVKTNRLMLWLAVKEFYIPRKIVFNVRK